LNNRFASTFIGNLSPGVKAVVSAEQLAAIVDNPQALVNVEAQTQLQGLFAGLGNGDVLFEQMLTALRSALNSALTQIFALFLIVAVLALLINIFLKGIPPHRSKEEIAAAESRE
jgi:hypothetical protein